MEPKFLKKNVINAIEKARKELRLSGCQSASIDFYENGNIAINSSEYEGFLFTYELEDWEHNDKTSVLLRRIKQFIDDNGLNIEITEN